MILRKFGSRLVVGQITKYLPAGGEYEPMLFKATHEDGDEEDLEEAEARRRSAPQEGWGRAAGGGGDGGGGGGDGGGGGGAGGGGHDVADEQ